MVNTPMSTRTKDFFPEYTVVNALNRVAEPIEVAQLVAFLLGDESKFITGVAYPIDGGHLAL